MCRGSNNVLSAAIHMPCRYGPCYIIDFDTLLTCSIADVVVDMEDAAALVHIRSPDRRFRRAAAGVCMMNSAC